MSTKRRMITPAKWAKLEVGADVILLSRARRFAPRLDHSGFPCEERKIMHGQVVHRRNDYIVLADVESFVVRRDEVADAKIW